MQETSKLEIIKKIKRENSPVIIFGAGTVGEALFCACNSAGIKVACFCDNNLNKTKDLLRGVKVLHVPDLKKKYEDAIFLISAADIKDVLGQLKEFGFSKWYPAGFLLEDFNASQYQFEVPQDFVQYAIDTCLLCQDSYLIPGKVFLRSVDIVITERCSLKCRDCSNLTPYFKNPRNYDLKELLDQIEKFCLLVDGINEFRVIGGEPFMNRDAHVIIQNLISQPKVKRVVIYTNGTIVPADSQIETLKNAKIIFMITDYGLLSRNIDTLKQKLQENNIAFYAYKAAGWTDCSKILKHNRTLEQNKELFKKCCAKNTFTLSNGKFFRCPFSANTHTLKAVPEFKEDFIDIFDSALKDSEIKEKLLKFILEKNFLRVCEFCNGRSFGDPEITPAVQAAQPIDYKKYE